MKKIEQLRLAMKESNIPCGVVYITVLDTGYARYAIRGSTKFPVLLATPHSHVSEWDEEYKVEKAKVKKIWSEIINA